MKNLKPNRIRFVKEAERIITEYKGKQAGSYRYDPLKASPVDSDWYIIKTAGNRLKLTIYNELDHKLLYSVFGMLELPDSRVGNPHSGKVNFRAHGDTDEAVVDFEDWLCGVLEILANESNKSTKE